MYKRQDEVGADDEQPAERGGGNGAGGADLQLIDEPEESAGGEQLPALLDEKQIIDVYKRQKLSLPQKMPLPPPPQQKMAASLSLMCLTEIGC